MITSWSDTYYPRNENAYIYSKTCGEWPLKIRQNKDINDKR